MVTLVFLLCAGAMNCSPPQTVAMFPVPAGTNREETRSICQISRTALLPGFRKAVADLTNQSNTFAVLECR
jgi:hypothetical protein